MNDEFTFLVVWAHPYDSTEIYGAFDEHADAQAARKQIVDHYMEIVKQNEDSPREIKRSESNAWKETYVLQIPKNGLNIREDGFIHSY